jgi:hypothetical protein
MMWWGVLAATLLVHHHEIHPELSYPDRIFQIKDTFKPNSHEFWEVVFLLNWLYEFSNMNA